MEDLSDFNEAAKKLLKDFEDIKALAQNRNLTGIREKALEFKEKIAKLSPVQQDKVLDSTRHDRKEINRLMEAGKEEKINWGEEE